eukprot:UN33526
MACDNTGWAIFTPHNNSVTSTSRQSTDPEELSSFLKIKSLIPNSKKSYKFTSLSRSPEYNTNVPNINERIRTNKSNKKTIVKLMIYLTGMMIILLVIIKTTVKRYPKIEHPFPKNIFYTYNSNLCQKINDNDSSELKNINQI